jgi:hypothetical protein
MFVCDDLLRSDAVSVNPRAKASARPCDRCDNDSSTSQRGTESFSSAGFWNCQRSRGLSVVAWQTDRDHGPVLF